MTKSIDTVAPHEIPMNALTPSQLRDALIHDLFPINQPAFVWGEPGTGKSSIVGTSTRKAWGDHIGAPVGFADVRLALFDPVDLRGLPVFNQQRGRMVFAPADFWPDEQRDGQRGILFWDEMNAAPLQNQAAAYQMILDRRLAEYQLPAGWQQVAAGNLETDRAVTNRMSSALASRFTHIRLVVSNQDWARYAVGANLNPFVIAFFRSLRPELLHAFNPKEKAYPCPRTVEMAARIVDQCTDETRRAALLAGTIGDGAAIELEGYLQIAQNIPDPDAVIMSPKLGAIPERPDVLYALTGAIARKATCANFDRVTEYAERLGPEFSTVLVLDAINRDQTLTTTAAFKTWAIKHDDALQGRAIAA